MLEVMVLMVVLVMEVLEAQVVQLEEVVVLEDNQVQVVLAHVIME